MALKWLSGCQNNMYTKYINDHLKEALTELQFVKCDDTNTKAIVNSLESIISAIRELTNEVESNQ